MESGFQEALNLFVRWIHVIAGIMWIGDSFLFMWMDRHLEPPSKPRDGAPDQIVGELWMTHSGGFYEVIKRKYLAKHELPQNLYWFKWESYTTWLSGFFLLFVVYYLNGASYLVDPTVAATTTAEGIALSLGLLVGGWFAYDTLWRSPLGKHPGILAPLCFAALMAIAYALSLVFSGRAAFLHVGAMMGTIMSANVFFRIVPGQRKMLAATMAGTPVDTSQGARAKMRSRHNHYMTLPVVFTMLSSHFAGTYGNTHPWLVLGFVFLFGAGLKYIMNYRGKAGWFVWIGTFVCLFAVASMASGKSIAEDEDEPPRSSKRVSFMAVQRIVEARCVTCHATIPSNPAFKTPPSGVILEEPAQLARLAPRVLYRVYTTKTMPLGNVTGMTDGERETLATWIQQGAKVQAAPRWDSAPPTPALMAQARTFYAERCVTCHGPTGRGDGPAAVGLMPRPGDLRAHEWHVKTTDDELARVLVQGGPANAKSPTMPPSLDLESNPALLGALLAVVRGFEDVPPTPLFPPAEPVPPAPEFAPKVRLPPAD